MIFGSAAVKTKETREFFDKFMAGRRTLPSFFTEFYVFRM